MTSLQPRTIAPDLDHPYSARLPIGLDAAAAYLGLEPAELAAWLDHGGSLTGIARTLGRPADGVLDIVAESVRATLSSGATGERERVLDTLRDRLVSGRTPAARAA